MRKLVLGLGMATLLVGVCWALDHIQDLGYEAAKLRELSYSPVRSQVVSQKECASYLMGLLDKEMDPTRTRKRESFLRHLGLLTGSRSMKQIYADILTEQVRGLYDPAQKRYLVVHAGAASDGGMGAMAATMGLNIEDIYTVHELCHAIQDQHFNLSQVSKKVADNFDEELAAQSLIEGDASVLMMDFAFKSIGMDPSQMAGMSGGLNSDDMMMGSTPAMAAAPRFFREILGFPYSQGLVFVGALRKRGGWREVDSAFRSLPESSEQIIHPEKYGRDHPRHVQVNKLPLDAGWQSLGRDSGGEFTMRIWAKENGFPESAAAGWGGDSYEVYAKGANTTAVWDTEWDSPTNAAEFEKLAIAAISKTRGGSAMNGTTRVWKKATLLSQCERKGSHVQLVFDYPREGSASTIQTVAQAPCVP